MTCSPVSLLGRYISTRFAEWLGCRDTDLRNVPVEYFSWDPDVLTQPRKWPCTTIRSLLCLLDRHTSTHLHIPSSFWTLIPPSLVLIIHFNNVSFQRDSIRLKILKHKIKLKNPLTFPPVVEAPISSNIYISIFLVHITYCFFSLL